MCAACVAQGITYVGGALTTLQVMATRAKIQAFPLLDRRGLHLHPGARRHHVTFLPDALRQQLVRRFDLAAPPATPEDIEASEERLGFRIPGPVRELYEIANGGAGFVGLINGAVDDLGSTVVDLYESFLEPEDDVEAPVPWQWRPGVLPSPRLPRRPKRKMTRAVDPGHLVVGTGVDPVTFRFRHPYALSEHMRGRFVPRTCDEHRPSAIRRPRRSGERAGVSD